MCAKKEKLIKDTKEKIQEIHDSTMDQLDRCIALMQPIKEKSHALPR